MTGTTGAPRFHFFWSGGPFPFVATLAVRSFLRCHPSAGAVVHVEGDERPVRDVLADEPGVVVQTVSLPSLLEAAGYEVDDFVDFLERPAPNHRSDLARYLILLTQGGVYADVDVLACRSMASVATAPFFAAFQYYGRGRHFVNGAVMGATAGSPLVRNLVDGCRLRAGQGEPYGWATFGPTLLTDVLLPRGPVARVVRTILALAERWGMACGPGADGLVERWLQSGPGRLLPRSRFYAVSCFSDEWPRLFEPGTPPPGAFGIHLWNGQSRAVTASWTEATVRDGPPSLAADLARRYL